MHRTSPQQTLHKTGHHGRGGTAPLRRGVLRLGAGGFTLVELLVVISILVIMMGATVTVINLNIGTDRMFSAARIVQSVLHGARDRAISAKEPRGVRFLLDPNNPTVITSMVYIGANKLYSEGTVTLEYDSPVGGEVTIVEGTDAGGGGNPGWRNLASLGLLTTGARIKIPADSSGSWYYVRNFSTGTPPSWAQSPNGNFDYIQLSSPYRQPPTLTNPYPLGSPSYKAFVNYASTSYLLELGPTVLPNSDPIPLQEGIVIDLDRCIKNGIPSARTTPANWGGGGVYANQLDIMFSPRGTVIGSAAAMGIIHLYLAEQEAAQQGLDPANPAVKTHACVSIFTQTGAIVTNQIDVTDILPPAPPPPPVVPPGDGFADNPFSFSERGEAAR